MMETLTVEIVGVLVEKSTKPNGTSLVWYWLDQTEDINEVSYPDPAMCHLICHLLRLGEQSWEL